MTFDNFKIDEVSELFPWTGGALKAPSGKIARLKLIGQPFWSIGSSLWHPAKLDHERPRP